jgi:glycosyltransferase
MSPALKISVITAVFNNRQTIAAAIDSALSQAGAQIELIVIDGGSTDGTLGVLRGYEEHLAVLVSEPDRGMYDALNKGIQRATGDVVGFLHSDDLFADERVLARIAAAFADPDVGAVYGDLQYVSKDDPDVVVRYWRSGEFSQSRLGWGWMPPHPTLYVRRAVYDRLGAFDLRYRIAADYDTMLRFLGKGKVRAAYIPEVLVKMRLGGASNRSLANIVRKSWEDYLVLRRNGIGGVGALAWKNLSKVKQFFMR